MSRLKIWLSVLLPTLAFFVFMAGYYAIHEWQRGIAVAEDEVHAALNNRSHFLAQRCREMASFPDLFAFLLANPDVPVSGLLEKTMMENPAFDGIAFLFDPDFLSSCPDGRVRDCPVLNVFGLLTESSPKTFAPAVLRGKNNELLHQNLAENDKVPRPWLLQACKITDKNWSDPFENILTGRRVIRYAVPFKVDDRVAGVVCLFVEVDSLFSSLPLTNRLEEDPIACRFLVLSGKGDLIAQRGYELVPGQTTPLANAELDRQTLIQDEETLPITGTRPPIRLRHVPADPGRPDVTRTCWFTFSPSQLNSDWVYVGIFDEDYAMRDVRTRIWKFTFLCVLAMSAAVAIVARLLVSANRPLAEMIRVAEQVAMGNLAVHVEPRFLRYGDRIGQLVRIFSRMVENLQTNVEHMVQESGKRMVLEHELMFARDVQTSFLPTEMPHAPDEQRVCFDARILPAKFVAGDFYDVWHAGNNTIYFLVADVSGKGAPAAMVMVATSTLVHQVVVDDQLSTGEILTRVNHALCTQSKNGLFVTMFFGAYHLESGIIEYSNAGHNPPLFLDSIESPKWLPDPVDFVLGVVPDHQFKTFTLPLTPSQRVFLYTDGVTDTMDAAGNAFGNDRLVALLSRLKNAATDHFLADVAAELARFQGPFQQDDTTMMLIERTQ